MRGTPSIEQDARPPALAGPTTSIAKSCTRRPQASGPASRDCSQFAADDAIPQSSGAGQEACGPRKAVKGPHPRLVGKAQPEVRRSGAAARPAALRSPTRDFPEFRPELFLPGDCTDDLAVNPVRIQELEHGDEEAQDGSAWTQEAWQPVSRSVTRRSVPGFGCSPTAIRK